MCLCHDCGKREEILFKEGDIKFFSNEFTYVSGKKNTISVVEEMFQSIHCVFQSKVL